MRKLATLPTRRKITVGRMCTERMPTYLGKVTAEVNTIVRGMIGGGMPLRGRMPLRGMTLAIAVKLTTTPPREERAAHRNIVMTRAIGLPEGGRVAHRNPSHSLANRTTSRSVAAKMHNTKSVCLTSTTTAPPSSTGMKMTAPPRSTKAVGNGRTAPNLCACIFMSGASPSCLGIFMLYGFLQNSKLGVSGAGLSCGKSYLGMRLVLIVPLNRH